MPGGKVAVIRDTPLWLEHCTAVQYSIHRHIYVFYVTCPRLSMCILRHTVEPYTDPRVIQFGQVGKSQYDNVRWYECQDQY